MEQEKKDIKKRLKLKVNPYSSDISLSDQLKELEQVKEFRLDLVHYENVQSVFEKISSYLSKHNELQQLEISLENNCPLNFEETLYQLRDLSQVTDLLLQLQSQPYYFPNQKITLSQCFEKYLNLLSLNIQIKCDNLEGQEHNFKLFDLYKTNPNLQRLDISLDSISSKSEIIYSVLKGIRFLNKLQSFSILLQQSKCQSFDLVDCIDEELKENNSLKEFSIYFGWRCNIEYQDFRVLNRILKRLQNLERLEIVSYNSSKRNSNIEELGFEESLSFLPNLKSLRLELHSLNKSLIKLLDIIAQKESIKNVQLKLTIKDPYQYGDDIVKFSNSLGKIANLTSLKLEFTLACKLFYSEVIRLLASLNRLNLLEELSIYASRVRLRNETISENEANQVYELVSKLKKFSYTLSIEDNVTTDINLIDLAVQRAQNLEELVVQIKNFQTGYNKRMKSNQFSNILENKNKLKSLSITIPDNFLIEIKELYKMTEWMSHNPQLTKLKILFLNSSSYSLVFLQLLGDSLRKLTNLEEFEIKFKDDCELSEEGFGAFIESLQEMHQMLKLTLEFPTNDFKLETLKSFAASFSKMEKLKSLSVSLYGDNLESYYGKPKLANAFRFPQKIEYLTLSIEGSPQQYINIQPIFKKISHLKNMKILTVRFEALKINLTESIELANYLSKLKLLGYLYLNHYSFNILYLFSLFKHINSLTNIDFQDEHLDYYSQKVKANRKLVYQKHLQIDEQSQPQQHLCNNNQLIKENYELQIKSERLFNQNELDTLNPKDDVQIIFTLLIPLTKLKIHIHDKNDKLMKHTDELLKNLPRLQNLQHIKFEIMKTNHFGNERLDLLGDALINLPQLLKFQFILQFEGNKISLTKCSKFFSQIGKLYKLLQLEITMKFKSIYENESEEEEAEAEPEEEEEEEETLEAIEDIINQQQKKQEEVVLRLCENLQKLKNLKSLKIQISKFQVYPSSLDEFTKMLDFHKVNLENLQILLKIQEKDHFDQLMRGLKKMQNLLYLEVNAHGKCSFVKIHKLKRLINCKINKIYSIELV